MKVERLLAQHTGRLYVPADTIGTHFYKRLSRPQGHGAAGRIKSMKKSKWPKSGIESVTLPRVSA
jgi:hypothetical protein